MRLAILALLVAMPLSAQRPNTCADPYWAGTLRCSAFPNQVPQPNRNDVPRTPQAVLSHTRVWVDEDPNLRCTDGTAPSFFVDKAVCTNPAGCGPNVKLGDPVDSNRWLFTFQGGDSCESGRCITFYASEERPNMGSSGNAPMTEQIGIHRPDPVRNPVFAGYNRIKVDKCTFDRYIGRTTQQFQNVRLFHHGSLIVEAAFAKLANGLQYTTWQVSGTSSRRRSCCTGESAGKVMQTTERLPPLASAETVLLIGHSNASHGLYHNADNLAAALAKLPGFRGDVRALFDANFQPAVENEAPFATTSTPNRDAYDGITAGTSSGSGNSFTYDAAVAFEGAYNAVVEYAAHGAQLDVSCLEAHATDGKAWKCRDRHHVLMNHIATPFAVREDQRDPNPDHLDEPRGNEIRWAAKQPYAHCTNGEPCLPRFDETEFGLRVRKQIRTMIDFGATRSELALGLDRSGTFPTFYAWMPKCASHEGAFGDTSFFETKIGSETYREWLEAFMRAPRTGTRAWRVDGMDGARTTQCR
jgi:Pectinacetylesterase